jgi:cytochrome c oxidase assembly protein subunit 15
MASPLITERLKKALSPILGLLLFLQAGILVTGGIVRLTESGLGCPTWPRCTDTSIDPEPDQVEGQFHAWIEFGNRLITVALVLVALLALLTVLILRRVDLRRFAIGQVAGIFAQIPLGGITVLTHLNPFSVAAHFLLSIVIIAGCTALFDRRDGIKIRSESLDKNLKKLLRLIVALTALVIVVGTGVTGTGPHAGDSKAPRFDISIRAITWIHASLVVALIGLLIFVIFLIREKPMLRRRLLIFLALLLVQGLVGTIQYLEGFPELLVGIHLFGVTLIWISAWRINLLTFSSTSIGESEKK